jgi:cell pole-organizing protein PopZ
MEEILASIRRIIADDEAKPGDKPAAAAPAPAAPAPPPPAKPAMKDIPPSAIPAAQAAAVKAAAPAPRPAPTPKPAPPPAPPPAAVDASNSQDDIDAMLASLEADNAVEEAPEPEAEADVFELTDEMALPDPPPPPPAAAFNKIDPQDDLEFTEARAAQRQPAPEPLRLEMPMPPILSRTTVNAVESAFNTLAHTVLSNNARTLEDLVKEMLRPMLKSWLDDNLPGLVERIVKAEIERVSRGR